jgi:glucose-6-phosphate isomerase
MGYFIGNGAKDMVICLRAGKPLMVQDGATSGDFLQGFWLATRQSLPENVIESYTLTVTYTSAFSTCVLTTLSVRVLVFMAL